MKTTFIETKIILSAIINYYLIAMTNQKSYLGSSISIYSGLCFYTTGGGRLSSIPESQSMRKGVWENLRYFLCPQHRLFILAHKKCAQLH